MPLKRSSVMAHFVEAGSPSAESGGVTHSVPADTIRYPRGTASRASTYGQALLSRVTADRDRDHRAAALPQQRSTTASQRRFRNSAYSLSLIHISEPTRLLS